MTDDKTKQELAAVKRFLETLSRDPWIEGRIKVAAKEALRAWGGSDDNRK